VRRPARPSAELPQKLESDLSSDMSVTEAELDAIERLLGEEWRRLLAGLA
jgi:hypothetical protein